MNQSIKNAPDVLAGNHGANNINHLDNTMNHCDLQDAIEKVYLECIATYSCYRCKLKPLCDKYFAGTRPYTWALRIEEGGRIDG